MLNFSIQKYKRLRQVRKRNPEGSAINTSVSTFQWSADGIEIEYLNS